MECNNNDHHQLSNPYAIELNNVTIRLSNKDILKSITLAIEQGGIFALLGPSGCGKTTLIRTLVGRLHPINNHDGTRGKISILGKDPHAYGQLVGFMPQEMALHFANTIDEELYFYGRLANMPSEKIQQRCQFLMNLLELSHKRKLIFKLSGGQQRRVSFAIALLHEPRLLILDEPTVGVDPLLRRNMLIIQFLVPILQITLFCLCVGRKLTNIPMGFISRETIRSSSTSGLIFDKIDKNVLNLIEYKSINEAQHLFHLGYLFGIIDIGENFTREIFDKVQSCSFSDVHKYNDSQMIIYLDETNRQMVYTIAEEFIRVFKIIDIDFNLGLFASTSSNHSLFKLGQFQNHLPKIEYTFTHFMIPGIILSVIFFFNVALTALSIVTEQSDGTQERVWITGVKSNQIILSQLIIHSLILIIQIVIVLFTSLFIFEIPLRGSLLYPSLLCIIQGFCGMTFGLVISTIFTTEINAHQVTMSIFYPVLLLSGIVWPLEGQPIWMRTISAWLPMTKAIDAMRGTLLKGWCIQHLVVQQAFMVSFLWSMVFLILTLLVFNCRRL
ncbi:unnamed protein product [Rotaria sp. Silwood1]|nr:unnamed protein product [Rotaria sp. Silwood1]